MATVCEPKSSIPPSSGGKLFAALAAFYGATNPHVGRAKLFGFDCLRTGGKLFAKLHGGDIVLRLPAERVAALAASGRLRPYARRGRPMKEWAVAASTEEKEIIALAEESRLYAEGG